MNYQKKLKQYQEKDQQLKTTLNIVVALLRLIRRNRMEFQKKVLKI